MPNDQGTVSQNLKSVQFILKMELGTVPKEVTNRSISGSDVFVRVSLKKVNL